MERCSQRDFEALPIPDLTLLAGHERMPVKPLMPQWGCPFDCGFCSVTAMFSRSVRYRGMIARDLTPGWVAQVRAAETVFASRRGANRTGTSSS